MFCFDLIEFQFFAHIVNHFVETNPIKIIKKLKFHKHFPFNLNRTHTTQNFVFKLNTIEICINYHVGIMKCLI